MKKSDIVGDVFQDINNTDHVIVYGNVMGDITNADNVIIINGNMYGDISNADIVCGFEADTTKLENVLENRIDKLKKKHKKDKYMRKHHMDGSFFDDGLESHYY